VNYWQHATRNLIIASILSTIFYTQHSHFFNSVVFYLGHFSMKDFWLGVFPCIIFLTPDLDSDNSIPSKLWGPLKIIWKPFDHREVLHHPAWGPFILIAPFWILFQVLDIEFGTWVIIGAVVAVEGHIIVDWEYSGWKHVKKRLHFKGVKKLRKVF
jgi:uncharacterized metal-binding protein